MKKLPPWAALGATLAPAVLTPAATSVPNIVFFLADDMGLGDSSAYQDLTGNPDNRQIYTPNMERLARRGTRYTDVHAPEALCTPTRLSFMTGTYSFRSPIIQETSLEGQDFYGTLFPGRRCTVPLMLRKYGYRNYGIGKWHMALHGDKSGTGLMYEGPLQVGFDCYTGTPGNFGGGGCMIQDQRYMVFDASGQMVHIKDPSAVPWGDNENPEMLKKIQPANLEAVQSYLSAHMSTAPDHPFFVYYASHANHTPYVSPDSLGGQPLTTNVTVAGTMISIATGADQDGDGIPDPADPDCFMTLLQGTQHWDPYYKTNSTGQVIDNAPTTRARMVRENDIIIGRLLDYLDETDDPRNPGHKLADNTIFIFTSDNGADIEFEFSVGALPQKSSGVITDLQGKKATRWEGGTRIPFIAVWPGRIATNATSDALFGLNDMYATFSEIVGHAMAPHEAVDSESLLTAWTNGAGGTVRSTDLLYKNKENLLIRRGDMKLMTKDPDYVNLDSPISRFDVEGLHLDFSNMTSFAMHNLSNDLSEAGDILAGQSSLAASMQNTVRQFVDQGFSRAGAERIYNGGNFQGGSLLNSSSWRHYTPPLNNQLPTATRPGFICIDGTADSSVSNMFLIQRSGAISFTGSSASQRQINNARWNIEAGALNFSNSTLYMAKGTSTLTVTDGHISGAQLDFGSAAGSSAGAKTVVLEKGSGTVTLTGLAIAPPAAAPVSIISATGKTFNVTAGTVSTSLYSGVSVQAGDVLVLTAGTNKKGASSAAPLSPVITAGAVLLGPVTELHNSLDTYPTSWGWYYSVTSSGTVNAGVTIVNTAGITANTACYVLRSATGVIALAAYATWDDNDNADNGTSYVLNYSFPSPLTNGVLIESISSRSDTITPPAAYTVDINGANKRILDSYGEVNGLSHSSLYTLDGASSNLTSGALGMVFQGLETSSTTGSVPPVVFGNDGDSSNDYISFTTGTRGRIISGENTAFYETLWTNGQLRIDGQMGSASFADSGFLVINRSGGIYELVLDNGQIIDDDDDGMNDTWEQRRAGGTGLLTATGDHDGDGLLDITEYILDSDPRAGSQDFTCEGAFDVRNLNFVVSFNATNSRMYRVEYKPDLRSSAAWQVLEQITGVNGLNTFRSSGGTEKGFYRIQVLLP